MTKTRAHRPKGIDFDNNLKEILKELFQDALSLIYPQLAILVDWGRQPEFLEQELRRLIKAYFRGAKYCDVLAKVWLQTGEAKWVLLHLEIEKAPKANFGKRMLEYRMLIQLKHQIEDILAVAFYVGGPSANQVDFYEYNFAGTVHSYRFPVYKAWEQDESALLASPNPFALVVLAIQYVLKTVGKLNDRMLFKEKLYELAMQRNMDEQKLARLIIFVDNFMLLPSKLDQKLQFKMAGKLDKLEVMTITPRNRQMAETIYKAVYGFSPQEFKKEIAKQKRAEKRALEKIRVEKEIALEISKLAEAERQAMLEKSKLAEAERQAMLEKIKEETQKKESAIRNLYAFGLPPADIAKNLELELGFVDSVLGR